MLMIISQKSSKLYILSLLLLLSEIVITGRADARELIIEEYKVVSQDDKIANDTIEYYNLVDPKVNKRRKWREDDWRNRPDIHKELKDFGCTHELNNLHCEGVNNDRRMREMECFVRNPNKRDFLMTGRSDKEYLYTRDTAQTWDSYRHAYKCPIFAGGSIMTIDLVQEAKEPDLVAKFAVKKDGNTIYSFERHVGSTNPLHSFFSWGEKWILELDGKVLIDGEDIGKKMGDAYVFDFRIIKDKPFFFFKKNGKYRISYDGKVLPNAYDDVKHYLCCEPSSFNPRGNKNMVRFNALKDGYWFYIEAGVYND